MLTPTHRVAKCAAVAAIKQYKNPHQASGAGDGRGNASGVQVSDGRARLVQHGACTGARRRGPVRSRAHGCCHGARTGEGVYMFMNMAIYDMIRLSYVAIRLVSTLLPHVLVVYSTAK